jgi:hypothetical protein
MSVSPLGLINSQVETTKRDLMGRRRNQEQLHNVSTLNPCVRSWRRLPAWRRGRSRRNSTIAALPHRAAASGSRRKSCVYSPVSACDDPRGSKVGRELGAGGTGRYAAFDAKNTTPHKTVWLPWRRSLAGQGGRPDRQRDSGFTTARHRRSSLASFPRYYAQIQSQSSIIGRESWPGNVPLGPGVSFPR